MGNRVGMKDTCTYSESISGEGAGGGGGSASVGTTWQ